MRKKLLWKTGLTITLAAAVLVACEEAGTDPTDGDGEDDISVDSVAETDWESADAGSLGDFPDGDDYDIQAIDAEEDAFVLFEAFEENGGASSLAAAAQRDDGADDPADELNELFDNEPFTYEETRLDDGERIELWGSAEDTVNFAEMDENIYSGNATVNLDLDITAQHEMTEDREQAEANVEFGASFDLDDGISIVPADDGENGSDEVAGVPGAFIGAGTNLNYATDFRYDDDFRVTSADLAYSASLGYSVAFSFWATVPDEESEYDNEYRQVGAHYYLDVSLNDEAVIQAADQEELFDEFDRQIDEGDIEFTLRVWGERPDNFDDIDDAVVNYDSDDVDFQDLLDAIDGETAPSAVVAPLVVTE